MSDLLVPVDTSKFCDTRVDECVGRDPAFVCGDTTACTLATLPPGYAVYKVEAVQHSEAETTIMSLSWCIIMLMTMLIFWFKGKAVPENDYDGPGHWSASVVTGLSVINTIVIVWSILVSLK